MSQEESAQKLLSCAQQTHYWKIHNQAAVLGQLNVNIDKMLSLRDAAIRSVNPTFEEGEAASTYWRYVFKAFVPDFKRIHLPASDRSPVSTINLLLNQAYRSIKSLILDEILDIGVSPHQSYVHQGERSLVFDLIEPYRPYSDLIVLDVLKIHGCRIPDIYDYRIKSKFTNTGKMKVAIQSKPMLLKRAMTISALSFKELLQGNRKTLLFPSLELPKTAAKQDESFPSENLMPLP